jgi:hypothetical protein
MPEALWGVFENAAAPQRIVLVLLYAALPATLVLAGLAIRTRKQAWRRIVAELRIVGPTLGLFMAGLNSFHMGQTIQKLPFNPTLKQVAPGIFEIATFASLGAFVGLVAAAAHVAVSFSTPGERTY